MLKTISKFFSKKSDTATPVRHIFSSGEHPINPRQISANARAVVEVLEQAGFHAYIVGGSVRDLILGLHPKDFDVATDARPWEVKPLFKRARIVGRRFQIVHVLFGKDIVEVSTFRSNLPDADAENRFRQQSDSGMLTRDNLFGSLEDDASRRDLTINALYYDPGDNSLHDLTNGLADIRHRCIRIIGNPATRFREDPVRMLRVTRFAASLGFSIDEETASPIARLAPHLQQVSAPRLFDESLKLFMSGQGLATFKLLYQFGLYDEIFPQTRKLVSNPDSTAYRLLEQAFTNTDKRIRSGKRVTPAFIYAALLWPAVQKKSSALQSSGDSPAFALGKAGASVIAEQISITAIPRRFSIPMREIWDLQLRLPSRGGSRAARLVEHPRFRAAYDFALLREESGEELDGLGEWWTRYQAADESARHKMVDNLDSSGTGSRSGRRRRSRNRRR